jgi:teichuronic acid biosynthesis glycosyltransferase TuaG
MTFEIKFSAVIPCYNDAKRIRRSVESCLSQSYPPHEVIIVDDGSNLETVTAIRSLLEQYSNKNVRAIFLEMNQGVSHARNEGLRCAKGDYICLLDSDDIWHPDKLFVANEYLRNTYQKVVLGHDFTYDLAHLKLRIDPRGRVVRKISFIEILFKNPITTPSLMIPSGLDMTFRSDMRYTEDHEFLLRLSRICKIFFLQEKLVFIDRKLGSEGGLSGEKWKMRKGEMQMYFLLCKSDWRFYVLFPFLISYSLLKHALKMFK